MPSHPAPRELGNANASEIPWLFWSLSDVSHRQVVDHRTYFGARQLAERDLGPCDGCRQSEWSPEREAQALADQQDRATYARLSTLPRPITLAQAMKSVRMIPGMTAEMMQAVAVEIRETEQQQERKA